LGLKVPRVLLPKKGLDLTKWCVIACDQYTSQPEYWKSVKDIVKDVPSTLNLIFPEVYLGDEKWNQEVIQKIKEKMCEYDRDGILEAQDPGFVLLDRQTPHVASRKGVSAAFPHLFPPCFVASIMRTAFKSFPVCSLWERHRINGPSKA
jgi:hypothetical protein